MEEFSQRSNAALGHKVAGEGGGEQLRGGPLHPEEGSRPLAGIWTRRVCHRDAARRLEDGAPALSRWSRRVPGGGPRRALPARAAG